MTHQIVGSPSSFVREPAPRRLKCAECHGWIPEGEEHLVSRDEDRVYLRLCSEDCRLDWDDRYWQDRADQRGMNAD